MLRMTMLVAAVPILIAVATHALDHATTIATDPLAAVADAALPAAPALAAAAAVALAAADHAPAPVLAPALARLLQMLRRKESCTWKRSKSSEGEADAATRRRIESAALSPACFVVRASTHTHPSLF